MVVGGTQSTECCLKAVLDRLSDLADTGNDVNELSGLLDE